MSFQGNAALREEEPFLHLHVALGRSDLTVIGGHLREAIVHPTLEVWLPHGAGRRPPDKGPGDRP
ncbi:MAG: DUF296 domain-containing protein [Chloroflexi bacterium]|nr:DUF296 domain-containing protein [Chloroflexota bacterium]